MTKQSYELFSLASATPDDSPFYGQAFANATVEANANFRRGIDLSAGFDFEAHLEGSIGKELSATLNGGVSASAGVAFQAAFPLDLFKEAGMVARLRAQAELAAYIHAAVGLHLDEFYKRVRGNIPSGPMNHLLEVFFEETTIEAGIWARAAFAAEIVGEAILTGTLLPNAAGGPGLTFSLQYAAGWGFGAGYEFKANLGFEDSRRMIDRLTTTLSELIVEEAEQYIEHLSETEAVIPKKAMDILRILIPIASRSVFQLGLDLAETAVDQQNQVATSSLVDSAIRQIQETILKSAIETAAKEIGSFFQQSTVLDVLLDLEETDIQQITDNLHTLMEKLQELMSIQVVELDLWLPALLDCLPHLEDFIKRDLLPYEIARGCQEAVAIIWSSGQLVNRLISWVEDPARGVSEIFSSDPIILMGSSGIADYVAGRLGKSAGSQLTLEDLVNFLLKLDIETKIRSISPEISDSLDWISTILESPSGLLFKRLFVELTAPTASMEKIILQAMTEAFNQGIQNEIIPHLLEPLKASNPSNKVLSLLIDELVTPSLVALPLVIIPRIAELGTEEMAVRFREAISSVLMQLIQRFTISSVNVLLEHALTEGEHAIRQVGHQIGTLGEQSPGFGTLSMAASRAILPFSITPTDVENLLILSGDLIHLWNTKQREPFIQGIQSLFAMGLSTEDTRNATFSAFLGSDGPTSWEDLEDALEQLGEGIFEMIEYAAPKLLELIFMHHLNEAKTLALAIKEGAEMVINAVEESVEWLGNQVSVLQNRLVQLANQISQFGAKIAGDVQKLADHLSRLVSKTVSRIRDAIRSSILPVLNDYPEWAREPFLDLFNGLFDAIDWLLTGPLEILSSVAGWAKELLTKRLETVAHDEQAVHDEVKRHIMSSYAPDISFDLQLTVPGTDWVLFEINDISFPAGEILNLVADTVFKDGVYQKTVQSAAADAVKMRGLRAQEQTTRQTLEGLLNEQKAKEEIKLLTPGRPLNIKIDSPVSRSIHTGTAILNLRIEGGNETFVKSTLGVPRRVSIKVNGVEFDYNSSHWKADSSGISFSAQIVPASPPALYPVVRKPGKIMIDSIKLEKKTDMTALLASQKDRLIIRKPGMTKTLGDIKVPRSILGIASRANTFRKIERIAERPDKVEKPLPVRGVGKVSVTAEARPRNNSISTPTIPIEIISRPTGIVKPDVIIGKPGQVIINPPSDLVTVVTDINKAALIPGRPGLNVVQVAVSDGKSLTSSQSIMFYIQSDKPN